MKRFYRRKYRMRINDKGFSLIEILISIAILVIIMVPLMGNFIRSMQMNKKAENYQIQSNLAASVMEGLKASSVSELIDEFNGSDFRLIPNELEDYMRVEPEGADEYRKTLANDERETDYFAIHGVKSGGSVYDVFIKLDAVTEYKKDEEALNNFNIPEIINLDEEANGLLFSNGRSLYSTTAHNPDQEALNSFVQIGKDKVDAAVLSHPDYIQYVNDNNAWLNACEEASMKAEPTPTPPPSLIEPTVASIGLSDIIKQDSIKQYVTKQMLITVNDTKLIYEIEYICEWPAETGWSVETQWSEDRIIYRIDEVDFAANIKKLYLFYEQSEFYRAHSPGDGSYADRITITNKNTANSINLFVVNQSNPVMFNPLLIEGRPDDDSIAISTNLSNFEAIAGVEDITDEVKNALFETYELNRIFDITINICKTETEQSNRYKEVYYTLSSTMER